MFKKGKELMQNIAVAMQEVEPPISAIFLSCTQQTASEASRCKAPGITAQTTSTLYDQNTVQQHQHQQQLTSYHVRVQGVTEQTKTQSAASATAYFLSCQCAMLSS